MTVLLMVKLPVEIGSFVLVKTSVRAWEEEIAPELPTLTTE